jgi:SAM-dependent methyltransferase
VTGVLDPPRWLGPVSATDLAVLATIEGPVLDVGCGPARHVRALLDCGVPALGIDVSSAAVRLARGRGAAVLRRSVFERVPAAGSWRTALLLDGSLGIGGDPVRLLRRVAHLLAADGVVVVEVAAPTVESAALVLPAGPRGAPVPWAQVGADDLGTVAQRAGLVVGRCRPLGSRWFGWLTG